MLVKGKEILLMDISGGLKNNMTILALDQATRTSGWSVFRDGDLIDFGHWEKTHDDIAVRIHSLCKEIESKI
ncbi:MAG: hypothetical protein E7270_01230 [Lachnospiraceae bacterium]|nr:hypothetical protein [Lachnospiraceae bacterium]